MPMVIPVIAAWAGAAGAVAAVAAGTATLASYIAIAGAVLTTVGAVTKKKDLMLLGGVMGFGAGLAGSGGAAAGEAGGQVAAEESAGSVFNTAADSQTANTALADNAANAAAQTGDTLGTSTLGSNLGGAAAPDVSPAVAYGQAGNPGMSSTLGSGATTTTSGTTGALDWLNKVGSVVKQNKELFQVGGQMLQGMFGPEAEALDLQKKELERRRRNSNTIVPLGQIGMIGSTLGKG
jgi:hypothetical protein